MLLLLTLLACLPRTGPSDPRTAVGFAPGPDDTADEDTAAVDLDGDGVTALGGDCDDADASIHPWATETWDGVDQDCDGDVDDLRARTGSTGWVQGASGSDSLGCMAVGAGDVDGDGLAEIEVGALYRNAGGGGVLVLPAEEAGTWAGTVVDDAASFEISGESCTACYAFQIVPPHPADVTGDGATDLVIAAAGSQAADSLKYTWAVYDGPLSPGLTAADAVISMRAIDQSWGRVRTEGDLDGDGTAEVVFADGGFAARDGAYGLVTAYDVVGRTGTIEAYDADVFAFGPAANTYCGQDIAVGDLDGDGYADLLSTCGPADADGGVYVIGGGSALDLRGAVTDLSSLAITGLGDDLRWRTAVTVGDFDGDAVLDVAAHTVDGVAVFYAPGAEGTLTTADAAVVLTYADGQPYDDFGAFLAAGDTNGDGAEELVVGGGYSSPALWIFAGGDLDGGPVATIAAFGQAEFLGQGMSLADIDGDGRDELVAAAPSASDWKGDLYVFDDQR